MDGVAWEENGNWKFDSSDTPDKLMQKHKGKKIYILLLIVLVIHYIIAKI